MKWIIAAFVFCISDGISNGEENTEKITLEAIGENLAHLKAELVRLRKEDEKQKTELQEQKAEVAHLRDEVKKQKSELQKLKSENIRQRRYSKTENAKQKTKIMAPEIAREKSSKKKVIRHQRQDGETDVEDTLYDLIVEICVNEIRRHNREFDDVVQMTKQIRFTPANRPNQPNLYFLSVLKADYSRAGRP